MKDLLYLFFHRCISFFLRTAVVYVEPLLQPWHKREEKIFCDPISATDILKYWRGLSEECLSILIRQTLISEDKVFARPYIRVAGTKIVCTDSSNFKETGYTPKTCYPDITFKNGHQVYDFSRIVFDRDELKKFEPRFKNLDEILQCGHGKDEESNLKLILAEIEKLNMGIQKNDSQKLATYLLKVIPLFYREYRKIDEKSVRLKAEEGQEAEKVIKKEIFLEELGEILPGLPASTLLKFWKLLPAFCKLTGREASQE
ncbi:MULTISPECIES: hypothetical protein [unclassified Desulfovibrio]|uniref:hypothetical protein n=1 Tax=unclassified Desulfovibrio TaxID=2593640 RepID=UPI002FDB3245